MQELHPTRHEFQKILPWKTGLKLRQLGLAHNPITPTDRVRHAFLGHGSLGN